MSIRVLFCFFVILSLSASDVFAAEPETVAIGLIYPVSGPMSTFGEDIAKSIPLLEQRFNSEQQRYRFRLVLEDGKFGNTSAAITAAKKLVGIDKVKFLVVGSSGEILQIASYVESSGVVAIAGFASHPDVKSAGDYIFRTYVDAGRGIEILSKDIVSAGYERLAVISEESSFTEAIKGALESFVARRIVFSEDFPLGTHDYNTIIAKARAKRPDAYYLNVATPNNFVALVRQLRASGENKTFYTYYTPSLEDVKRNLGVMLNGIRFLDFPETLDESNDFREVMARFEETTGEKPRAQFNFRTNYNAIRVVVDSINAVGPYPNLVKNYLYSYDRPSATGRLRFDRNGDVRDLNLVLKDFRAP